MNLSKAQVAKVVLNTNWFDLEHFLSKNNCLDATVQTQFVFKNGLICHKNMKLKEFLDFVNLTFREFCDQALAFSKKEVKCRRGPMRSCRFNRFSRF